MYSVGIFCGVPRGIFCVEYSASNVLFGMLLSWKFMEQLATPTVVSRDLNSFVC